MDWTLGLGLLVTATVSALGALMAVASITDRLGRQRASIFAESGIGAVFLFDGDTLIDSTPTARAILSSSQTGGGPWARLMAFLVPHIPDLESRIAELARDGAVSVLSDPDRGDPLMVHAELRGGLVRICLSDPKTDGRTASVDHMALRANTEELGLLRDMIARAPILTWREDGAGDVIWANKSYLDCASATLEPGQETSWPLPRLFERTASLQGVAGQRQTLSARGDPAVWYDLFSSAEKEGRLLYALPANAAVQAEGALRDFMQTLTKTFAHLPIGLAIFDQHRKLQLFNPALLDLTGLPVDFLSLRPSLISVLDALRDRNMIPEPKNYRSWRQQLVELEKAAASGLYEETWNLPDGQTYRVVGRPHPNGALALMIEDVSTEMLRTRRYRAELELGQAVVDEMDEAITVFAPSGHLVMCNTAYARLWGHDPAGTLDDSTVRSLSSHWRALSAPGALWSEVEDFVATVGDRQSWRAETRLLDGRMVACRFAPLAGGATLAAFCPLPPKAGQTRATDSHKRRSA